MTSVRFLVADQSSRGANYEVTAKLGGSLIIAAGEDAAGEDAAGEDAAGEDAA